MALTRRQFLQCGAVTAAAITSPHPLLRAMFGARTAHATPADAVVVIIQLQGGNDGLNTLIPIDDAVTVQQRTLYEAARPNLRIAPTELFATEIDADPVKGNRLALHPAMTDLRALYDLGKLAVVAGVGYPNPNLSHFESEDIWFSGDAGLATPNSGWFGRYLESSFTPTDLVAIDIDNTMCPLFLAQNANILTVQGLSAFNLPSPDLAANEALVEAMYEIEADSMETSGVQLALGAAGKVLLGQMDDYAAVSTNWSSHLDPLPSGLARRLKQIASILRYDAQNPSTPLGARFFHVRIGGFDTHTQQGTAAGNQATLLESVAQAMKAFYDDTVDLGAASRCLTMTFSEFGRRVAENGNAGNAGTDHGAASVLFVAGEPVTGGVYGTLPALNDLDSGNLKSNVDFRQVYATIIDKWLATPGAHVPLLPDSPYTTLSFLA